MNSKKTQSPIGLKIIDKIELPVNKRPKNKPYFKTHKEVNGGTFKGHATNSLADFIPEHLKPKQRK